MIIEQFKEIERKIIDTETKILRLRNYYIIPIQNKIHNLNSTRVDVFYSGGDLGEIEKLISEQEIKIEYVETALIKPVLTEEQQLYDVRSDMKLKYIEEHGEYEYYGKVSNDFGNEICFFLLSQGMSHHTVMNPHTGELIGKYHILSLLGLDNIIKFIDNFSPNTQDGVYKFTTSKSLPKTELTYYEKTWCIYNGDELILTTNDLQQIVEYYK